MSEPRGQCSKDERWFLTSAVHAVCRPLPLRLPPSVFLTTMFVIRQLRIDAFLFHLLLFNVYALVQGGVAPHRPLITPPPAAHGQDDAHQALRRQLATTSLADTCGYVNAAVCKSHLNSVPFCQILISAQCNLGDVHRAIPATLRAA